MLQVKQLSEGTPALATSGMTFTCNDIFAADYLQWFTCDDNFHSREHMSIQMKTYKKS